MYHLEHEYILFVRIKTARIFKNELKQSIEKYMKKTFIML